jgi:hypothetical protein
VQQQLSLSLPLCRPAGHPPRSEGHWKGGAARAPCTASTACRAIVSVLFALPATEAILLVLTPRYRHCSDDQVEQFASRQSGYMVQGTPNYQPLVWGPHRHLDTVCACTAEAWSPYCLKIYLVCGCREGRQLLTARQCPKHDDPHTALQSKERTHCESSLYSRSHTGQ